MSELDRVATVAGEKQLVEELSRSASNSDAYDLLSKGGSSTATVGRSSASWFALDSKPFHSSSSGISSFSPGSLRCFSLTASLDACQVGH